MNQHRRRPPRTPARSPRVGLHRTGHPRIHQRPRLSTTRAGPIPNALIAGTSLLSTTPSSDMAAPSSGCRGPTRGPRTSKSSLRRGVDNWRHLAPASSARARSAIAVRLARSIKSGDRPAWRHDDGRAPGLGLEREEDATFPRGNSGSALSTCPVGRPPHGWPGAGQQPTRTSGRQWHIRALTRWWGLLGLGQRGCGVVVGAGHDRADGAGSDPGSRGDLALGKS